MAAVFAQTLQISDRSWLLSERRERALARNCSFFNLSPEYFEDLGFKGFSRFWGLGIRTFSVYALNTVGV